MKATKVLVTILLYCTAMVMAGNTTKIIVHAGGDGETISRHIYGHFAEHLGRCIYEGIWVGEDSDIPNVRGYRKDVLKALKEMGIPNLRWPGGCFADTYHWMDGVGPRDKRPEIVNVHWGGVTEDNSFGTHEFMGLCEELDCEPVICGNVGSGTVQEMAEWVEYLTSDALSPMTRLRKIHGRKDPWKIKFWGIGNESWGCGGTMTADYYSDQLRQYATFCRNYGDNRLFKIGCGPYSNNYQWTDVIMREWAQSSDWSKGYMQGLSLHHYTVCHTWEKKGSATDFNVKEWFLTLSQTMLMERYIEKHDSIMTLYDPDKEIALIVDEWGNWHDVEPGTNPGFLYQQNTLRDALVAAINLNIFNNHCDRVKMANIAQTVNVLQSVLLTQGKQMVRTPTWHVFKLYKVHHDAMLLPIKLQSSDYVYGDQSMVAVTVSASQNSQGLVHISLTNANPDQPQTVVCELLGMKATEVQGEIITAKAMNAYNDFGKPENVFIQSFKDGTVKDGQIKVELPSKSIVMLTLEVLTTE